MYTCLFEILLDSWEGTMFRFLIRNENGRRKDRKLVVKCFCEILWWPFVMAIFINSPLLQHTLNGKGKTVLQFYEHVSLKSRQNKTACEREREWENWEKKDNWALNYPVCKWQWSACFFSTYKSWNWTRH